MFEEVTVVDNIAVLEDGQLQVRRAIRVLKDGVKIAEKFHREVLVPGQDLTGQDAKILAIADVVWTQAVIDAYVAATAAALAAI